MTELKYKVGDKVQIKSLDWYNQMLSIPSKIVGKGDFVAIECGTHIFTKDMSKFCGMVMTIQDIGIDFYLMEEDNLGYDFTDEMIECKVEEDEVEFTEEDKYWCDLMSESDPTKDMGEVSDGYHTFNELYEYRLLYNASMFNELAKQNLYDVHKSKRHSDGEIPFGDSNWFIVMAELPTGQISNHYEMKDWDLFDIPEKEIANEWDGHTPKDVAERLRRFLTPKSKYPQTYEECCKVLGVNPYNYLTIRNVHCYDGEEERTKYERDLLGKFDSLWKLRICRDAYWKIAGEKMGLGEPWQPDWNSLEPKHVISISKNSVKLIWEQYYHRVFAFPTEEMRDAFYKAFEKEIEACKELI